MNLNKHIATLFMALVSVMTVLAQSRNPASQKEIQDKINQAQQQLDKLSPEQKRMMEQLGMSAKVPALPAGVSDADVKAAVSSGEGFGVPSKNMALIGAIPQITLVAATVPSYVKTLNGYVEKSIANDAKLFGQQVYKDFKVNNFDALAIGNAAVGHWTTGNPEVAVYLMGRACADNAADDDLLCNFAAMLSMGGAPHRAIPLLEYLGKKYPDNTTILNNLGQAWFYLGEMDKANEKLDKAVKAFAYHPQANYTQCLIEQSKGNTTKAVDKMKNSLSYSASLSKINMLRKLGYKIKGSDMRKPFKPDPNPLGLKNIIRPAAPTNYASELKLKAEWDAFEKQVNEKNSELTKKLQPYLTANNKKALETYNKIQGKTANEILAAGPTLSKNSDGRSVYAVMADINLNEMGKDGGMNYRIKTAKAAINALLKDYNAKKDAKIKELEKAYRERAGETSEYAKKGEDLGTDECKVKQLFSQWVYDNYNKPLEEAYQNYLHQLYIKITEELYWKQFKYTDAEFEQVKIGAKQEWLVAVSARYIETYHGETHCNAQQVEGSGYKLADFDDMHCKYHTSLNFGGGNSIETHCNKMTVKFNGGPLSGNLNYKSDSKGIDRLVNGTVEATVFEKSIGKGPLEASVKAGMGVEFTSKGVEDVYVNGEASAGTVSATGKMSLISGSMTGAISGFGK
ncbi:tetratricopeptide repeat protein [Chitinophaga sp. NPDC101104]|uniref:tetratricopeptide repeat protein n=1 Tax=Chitinophaga sp. NPDC101104 TaxID=3390561 RepID=UPI003CFE8250